MLSHARSLLASFFISPLYNIRPLTPTPTSLAMFRLAPLCRRAVVSPSHRPLSAYPSVSLWRGYYSDAEGKKLRAPPMVYISGEEMTAYAMKLVMDKWVLPRVDTSRWEYYDLSCKSRDDTEDKVDCVGNRRYCIS